MDESINRGSRILRLTESLSGITTGKGNSKIFMWMCLLVFKILTFAVPTFVPIYHPSNLHFFQKKTLNFAKTQSFGQNTPKLCKLGVFICDENISITILKSEKKGPKRLTHKGIPCQYEYPPLRLNNKVLRLLCIV